VSIYRTGAETSASTTTGPVRPQPPPQVLFYIKLRRQDKAHDHVKSALDRICLQGWGHGTARGLGRIRLKSLAPSPPPPEEPDARGFVSLSHFTPAKKDPTEGQWKLRAKHPVPAQFLDGRKITLGEEER